MDKFLLNSFQSQGISQTNFSQQSLVKELAQIQKENQRLSSNLQELKEQNSCLIQSLTNVKQENHVLKTELGNRIYWQSLNLRQEKSSERLKQFAELTESLFLKNYALNDPMDVEPQISIHNQN